jgi:hypothetical protein
MCLLVCGELGLTEVLTRADLCPALYLAASSEFCIERGDGLWTGTGKVRVFLIVCELPHMHGLSAGSFV